jgi:hypothetical protein
MVIYTTNQVFDLMMMMMTNLSYILTWELCLPLLGFMV